MCKQPPKLESVAMVLVALDADYRVLPSVHIRVVHRAEDFADINVMELLMSTERDRVR